MVTSVARVLSVFHFWLKLRPSSFILYLVSRFPEAFPVSMLLEPDVLNSWRDDHKHIWRISMTTQVSDGLKRFHTHRHQKLNHGSV